MKKTVISLTIIIVFIINCISVNAMNTSLSASSNHFTDVPEGSWAESYITQAVSLGIIKGYSNEIFGFGDKITRAEFAALLVRLFGWEKVTPSKPTFADNSDESKWYYSDIETATAHGVVLRNQVNVRPEADITREEMAIMLVRSLGYDTLAADIQSTHMPFTDVTENKGVITLAYDFGIINGTTATTYNPKGLAMREETAAMIIRMYDKYSSKLQWLHDFYAISSYSQKSDISKLDSLSFGWSRLEYTVNGGPYLNTTSADSNEYSIPSGYSEVVQLAKNSNVPADLDVYMSTEQEVKLPDGTTSNACSEILLDATMRSKAVSEIVDELKRENNYSGVTIDFEGMKGAELKAGLSEFLKELRSEMDKMGLKIYVCVPPATSDGVYFDGYDYRIIGQYADKVILMAYDYQANSLTASLMDAGFTTTPLTPIDDVYFALEAITDSKNGVQDKSKIAMGISFGSVEWSLQNGKVINQNAYMPDTASIYKRLINPDTTLNYSQKYQNPYITFSDDNGKTNNIVWYEDERSISAKVELARMFGINSVSVWRLGLIPEYTDAPEREIYYNVMQYLLGQKG